MPRESRSHQPAFGFVSTLESAEHGYFGGYLIVSPLGRPLEFHCTCPVRPSRAQAILYGPTLDAYLIGEQIAGSLLQAAKIVPRLILTDTAAILSARTRSRSPMVQLMEPLEGHEAVDSFGGQFETGGYKLQLPVGFEMELSAVAELAAELGANVDLVEPFGRIHEAIREAQRIGSRAVEDHEQAA